MFCRKPTKPIVIFKGDDTNFDNNRKLFFEIESLDALNPTKIEFSFLGVKRVFDTIPADGRFEVSFSREETAKFPLGTSFATLVAIDSDDRERTLDNRIAILVTNNVNLAYCSDDDKLVSIKIGTINADIVPPNEEAQTGEAADAKATYEALKTKASNDDLEAEERRAKEAEEGLDERITELENGGGGVAELMIETTHAELKTLRDTSELIPGMQYRITDYVATTVQEHTQSANHPFDIIVTADSVNELNEVARAIRHEGDTYFPETTKFEAWQIWYSLDNDTNRFEWADEANGKGVIYRMIDEFDNDVPYDFKGIKMQAYGIGGEYSDDYRYTFGGSEDNSIRSYFIEGWFYVSYSNKIKPYNNLPNDVGDNIKLRINLITLGLGCYSNTFGEGCCDITLGDDAYCNTFGFWCYSNILGSYCTNNTFGDYCHDNILGDGCYNNTFCIECHYNTFGTSCSNNTFGDSCYENVFSAECYGNTFGSLCCDNTLFGYCQYIILCNGCYHNSISNFFSAITLQNSVDDNIIECTADRGEYEYCRNIEIKSGVTYKEINIYDVEQSYHTEIRPENSITITV